MARPIDTALTARALIGLPDRARRSNWIHRLGARRNALLKRCSASCSFSAASTDGEAVLHRGSPELIPPSLGPSAEGCVARRLHTDGYAPSSLLPLGGIPFAIIGSTQVSRGVVHVGRGNQPLDLPARSPAPQVLHQESTLQLWIGEHVILAHQPPVEPHLAPPYSARWISTRSQWMLDELPLGALS